MSNFKLIAATAALAISLSPAAFAGSSQSNVSVIGAGEGGSLPAVTVSLSRQYTEYTGMAPVANADHVAVWSPLSAHDYTGEAPLPSAAQVARLPVWNVAMAHDYVTE